MLRDIELRHLYTVIVLAEEMHFTRASHRLRIAQPSLSKRIQQIEQLNGVVLFAREKRRIVELTEAGRIFLEEAKVAVFHAERALNLARAADCRSRDTLVIGYSLDADQAWVSDILRTRSRLYPQLRVCLSARFAMELVRDILVGELNLALVTVPQECNRITAIPFARRSLYAVLPKSHRHAGRKELVLRDLACDDWIVSAKQVHPTIHDAVLEAAKRNGITTKLTHFTLTEEQAIQLVLQRTGVAILTNPCALGHGADRVVMMPLSDESLHVDTCLVMRAGDDSKFTNEFARSFLRGFSHRLPPSAQANSW